MDLFSFYSSFDHRDLEPSVTEKAKPEAILNKASEKVLHARFNYQLQDHVPKLFAQNK